MSYLDIADYPAVQQVSRYFNEALAYRFRNRVHKSMLVNCLGKQEPVDEPIEFIKTVIASMQTTKFESRLEYHHLINKFSIRLNDNQHRFDIIYTNKCFKLLDRLIANNILYEPNDVFRTSHLHKAVCTGDLEFVKAMIDKFPILLNGRDLFELTALSHAVALGNFEMTRLLVTAGATLEPGQLYKHMNPLALAVYYGYHEIVEYLLNDVSDVNFVPDIPPFTMLNVYLFGLFNWATDFRTDASTVSMLSPIAYSRYKMKPHAADYIRVFDMLVKKGIRDVETVVAPVTRVPLNLPYLPYIDWKQSQFMSGNITATRVIDFIRPHINNNQHAVECIEQVTNWSAGL